jgi:2-dehydropantoate 2-reductase
MLETCLAGGGVAVTLQNGLGNLEKLAARLGERRASLGVTTSGATLLGPGRIRAGGDGVTHLAGREDLAPLAELLGRAGFVVQASDDVEGMAWGKAVINAAINPVAALLRIPNGELLSPDRAGAWEISREAASEAAAVAAARGVRLPFADAPGQVAEVLRRTATNRSSMLQDVERGRPTEVDAINGAIVAEGERLGVPTPVNRLLWNLVRSLPSAAGAIE